MGSNFTIDFKTDEFVQMHHHPDISPTDWRRIPPAIRDGLKLYVEHYYPVGHFLTAVLSNDLFQAVGRADADSMAGLNAIVSFIYCECPSACHGSREKVKEWLDNWVDPGEEDDEDPEEK